MFELNILSVFAATFLAIAIGIIWYSPWVFGNAWLRMVGIPPSQMEAETGWRRIVVGGILHFFLFLVLGRLLVLANVEQENFLQYLSLVLGIVLVLMGSTVVAERKPIGYLSITGGYTLLVIAVGMSVIFFWPW